MGLPDDYAEILDRLRERRALVFASGEIGRAASVLGEEGWTDYALLGTGRSLAQADPALGSEAAITLVVPPGPVPEAAASIAGEAAAPRLVAVGGGQVVDTAKAIASLSAECEVAAVPTTLAGSAMTRFHRFPDGHTPLRSVRPSFVIADPAAMCSAPADLLRATAANAMAHATDCLFGVDADDSSRADALRAVRLIAEGQEASGHEGLALGALSAGDALDRAGFGLQHALAQSVVAASGSPDHARIHAAILPFAIGAQVERRPQAAEGLADALGGSSEARLGETAGSKSLESLGVDREVATRAAEMAAVRPEAADPPEGDPWTVGELQQILVQAGAGG